MPCDAAGRVLLTLQKRADSTTGTSKSTRSSVPQAGYLAAQGDAVELRLRDAGVYRVAVTYDTPAGTSTTAEAVRGGL